MTAEGLWAVALGMVLTFLVMRWQNRRSNKRRFEVYRETTDELARLQTWNDVILESRDTLMITMDPLRRALEAAERVSEQQALDLSVQATEIQTLKDQLAGAIALESRVDVTNLLLENAEYPENLLRRAKHDVVDQIVALVRDVIVVDAYEDGMLDTHRFRARVMLSDLLKAGKS